MTWRPGTISPGPKGWISNLPSLISLTSFATVGEAPHNPSRLFGKLDVIRHFNVGVDCAIAGEATATAAPAAPMRAKFLREMVMRSPLIATATRWLLARSQFC